MNILFVGALSWNPERFISLCERGHRLFGLWTGTLPWEQGPYTFAKGYITDVTLDTYVEMIKKEKIDILYSLFQAYYPEAWTTAENKHIPNIWSVLRRMIADRKKGLFDIPIVRHWGFDTDYFDREIVPFLDGHIFCNKEKYAYWTTSKEKGGLGIDLPYDPERIVFMDSDMPKEEFMNNNFSKKLSEKDNRIHTVCVGRPLWINYPEAAKKGIHIHVYCNNFDDIAEIISQDISFGDLRKLLGSYIHVHPSLQVVNGTLDEIRARKSQWVPEFSKYDAGWSYVNMKEWSSLSLLNVKSAIPNRISTYMLAGLPVITEVLPGHYRYDILKKHGINIDCDHRHYDSLYEALSDKTALRRKAERARLCRKEFTFERSIDDLMDYFHRIQKIYYSKPRAFDNRLSTEICWGPLLDVSTTSQIKTAPQFARYVYKKIKKGKLIARLFNRIKRITSLILSLPGRLMRRMKIRYIKIICKKRG
jgi:hypothetical protein